MRATFRLLGVCKLSIALLLTGAPVWGEELGDPLPNWNDTPNRALVLDFVARVTQPGPDFVEPAERIAVFDLDGTLICERPNYLTTLLSHAMLRERLAADPSLAERPVYRALIEEDATFLRRNFRDVHLEAFAGLSHEEMHAFILEYINSERHPVFGLLHREMVYVPMVELVRYLEQHQFEVYVVSASMQEFVRAIGEPMLGIPPQRVIGSAVAFDIERREGKIRSVRRQEWFEPYNLREGKSIRILERIGRRPIFAFGNGNGDIDMLRLAALNPLPSLALVLNHDDDERGMFDRKPYLLRVAEGQGWPIIGVREDFRVVYPGNPQKIREEEESAELDEAASLPQAEAGGGFALSDSQLGPCRLKAGL